MVKNVCYTEQKKARQRQKEVEYTDFFLYRYFIVSYNWYHFFEKTINILVKYE